MIITKIKRIRGKRMLYRVLFDNSVPLELSEWTIGKFGLRTGDDLSEQELTALKTTESETRAKNIAINFLSYRPRSSKEVIVHLTKKGFEPELAGKIAMHLVSLNMIDDIKFARAFVTDQLKRKPTGRALLRQQLLIKGIPSSTADNIISELVSQQSQQVSAFQAAKRKLDLIRRMKKGTDPEKRKKLVIDFLLRRGFTYEIAVNTVRKTMDL